MSRVYEAVVRVVLPDGMEEPPLLVLASLLLEALDNDVEVLSFSARAVP